MAIIAGAAVVLVCLTGTAALMGWIPSSAGAGADAEAAALALAPTQAAQQHIAPKPVVHRQPLAEPKREVQAALCQSCGTVASIREISSPADGSGLGAAGGAVVGGLLGNQVGGGHGKQAMTVVGAIGGALAGNQIEKRVRATQSYETTVHMNNGSTRTIAQATQPEWRNGDRVKIVNGVVQLRG